jgi:glycerate-2-kinase
LAGGETTVKMNNESRIKNYGKGGRNLESVLGVLSSHSSLFIIRDSVVVSFASDGHDNTEAAGAVGDILTLEKAKKAKLNPRKFLKSHDSFNFFKETGDLIYADRKSFNVADLMIVLTDD